MHQEQERRADFILVMKNRSEHFSMKYDNVQEILKQNQRDSFTFILEDKASANLPFSSTLIRQMFKEGK